MRRAAAIVVVFVAGCSDAAFNVAGLTVDRADGDVATGGGGDASSPAADASTTFPEASPSTDAGEGTAAETALGDAVEFRDTAHDTAAPLDSATVDVADSGCSFKHHDPIYGTFWTAGPSEPCYPPGVPGDPSTYTAVTMEMEFKHVLEAAPAGCVWSERAPISCVGGVSCFKRAVTCPTFTGEHWAVWCGPETGPWAGYLNGMDPTPICPSASARGTWY